jgi:hypothetical protein
VRVGSLVAVVNRHYRTVGGLDQIPVCRFGDRCALLAQKAEVALNVEVLRHDVLPLVSWCLRFVGLHITALTNVRNPPKSLP